MRSRPLVPSTISLSHRLFVSELVPISGHHGVLRFDGQVGRAAARLGRALFGKTATRTATKGNDH